MTRQGWALGTLVSHACSAASQVVMAHLYEGDVQRFLRGEPAMTTHTLAADSEAQLLALADALRAAGVPFAMRAEAVEDGPSIPTAIAAKPSELLRVAPYFSKMEPLECAAWPAAPLSIP